MKRVDNKIVIVTGGALGMGRTHSVLLAKEGATVIVTDVNESEGENTVKIIKDAGGQAEFLSLNVANEDNWAAVADSVVEKYGRIDILINNAGILMFKQVQDTSADDFKKIFDVNVNGVFYGTKAVLAGMQKAGAGSIINISSMYGLIGAPAAAAYIASKGAVRLLTKATAIDYAQYKIRVNSVHPGVIDTNMTKDLLNADAETVKAIMGTTIIDRPAQPEEVSNAVLFLASDEASFMTGSEMVVDGGYTAQ